MSRTELPVHSYDECNLHGKRHFNYMWSHWCCVYGRWNMSASLRPTHYENSVREHKNISFFCWFMWIVMLWRWELIFKIPFGFKVVLVSKPAQLIEIARVFFSFTKESHQFSAKHSEALFVYNVTPFWIG